MRITSLLLLAPLLLLPGCEEQKPARMEPVNLVPFTAIVQTPLREDRIPPGQVLPASHADVYIPRYAPFAYGPSYYDFNSYIRTYDYQPIGIPNTGGSGYRYRYIIQPLP